MARRVKPRLTLKPVVLKDLISKEAVDTILFQGVEGGFHILIGFGTEEKPLGLARGDRERTFKTLAAADRYLAALGVVHYSVDKSRHSPAAKQSKSPGRAAARERTQMAVAADADYLQSVETAIEQIDAGTVEIIPLSREYMEAKLAQSVARVRAWKARQEEEQACAIRSKTTTQRTRRTTARSA